MKYLRPSMWPRKELNKKGTEKSEKVSPAAINVPKQLAHKVLSFLHLENINSYQMLSDNLYKSLSF